MPATTATTTTTDIDESATRPSPGSSTHELDHEVGELFMNVMEQVKDHFLTALSGFDLTPAQAFALRHLHQPCPMGELADDMGYDASHITGIVDRLEERGLVERRVDPHDRRVKLVVLTHRGGAMQTDIEAQVFDQLPFLARLDTTQRESLRDLLRLLQREPTAPRRRD